MSTQFDVEISRVTKVFGKAKAVDDVSLQIARGKFLTLLGPSGCGKTTLLRMIAGFETPTEGKILLDGQDVTNIPPYKRNVHTVFQQYALFPHRTVSGNIAFGLERRGLAKAEIKKKIAEAIELVQLQGLEDRYPNQLSGGQQQRVAIARAVILEPRVLLLDEPLGALDLKLRKEMQIELKKLQRRLGISFIFVTHDQEEALTMSDRIAVMRQGHIEQIGSAQEIYEHPRTEFVADFIGVSNIISVEVVSTESGRTRLRIGDTELSLTTTQTLPANGQIKIAVRPEKIRLSQTAQGLALAGIIEERVYLGDSTHWRIRLKDGSLITVFEQNHSINNLTSHYTIGQSIYLNWDEQNSILFDGVN
ncbi:MAG: ABC transporter ATP-binding protein [Acidobacteriota bacterium]